MRIQNISIANNYAQDFGLRRKMPDKPNFSAPYFSTLSYISRPYNIESRERQEEEFFHEFINKKGKVSRSEYENIRKIHPRTLSRCYEICEEQTDVRTRPETMAKFAVSLKDYYDNKYDKDYTIISVGTSPSPVTEVMNNLGCNVIYLPITGLRFLEHNPLSPFRRQYPTIASRNTNIERLMKYASKKGIANKNKGQLVVLDYSATGKTLATMGNILKERKDIEHDRIHLHSLNRDLEKICKDENSYSKYGIDAVNIIEMKEDLYCSDFEKITNVPHFPYDEPRRYSEKKNWQLYRDFETYSQPEARAWALCTTHEAMKLIKQINKNHYN